MRTYIRPKAQQLLIRIQALIPVAGEQGRRGVLRSARGELLGLWSFYAHRVVFPLRDRPPHARKGPCHGFRNGPCL